MKIEEELPHSAIADEHDVSSLYNLLLRRDGESHEVIRNNIGRPLLDIFVEFLNSTEFYEHVLPAIITKTAGSKIYDGEQSLEQLLVWVGARLPLRAELRERLVGARSWTELDGILFSDQDLLDQFPRIRDTGAARAVALRKLDGETAAAADIRGSIDFANVWEIRGWCVDIGNLAAKVTVDIYGDNELLGAATCHDYRRDIHEKIGGDGHCGFTFSMPAAAQETFQVERRVTIRLRSSGATVGSGVLVHADLPRRIDAIEKVREEFLLAKDAIAKLETRLAWLTGSVGYSVQAYDEYARLFDQITPELAEEYRRNLTGFSVKPTISVVLMLCPDDPERAEASARSIQAQLFGMWELVVVGAASAATGEMAAWLSILPDRIPGVRVRLLDDAAGPAALMREGLAQCSGGFVIFLRAGDRLAPDAVYQNLAQIQRPGAKAIYADEDCYCLDGDERLRRHSPRFKPDMDLDYLLADDYIGRFVAFERATLAEIGGPRQDISGAEAFDLLLRFIEAVGVAGVVHLPRVIYHRWQADEPAAAENAPMGAAASDVVNDYLVRNRIAATAEPHCDAFGRARRSATRLRWNVPEPSPTVSLIIPTKDHPELLGPCLASVLATTARYRGRVEILVVDNGGTDPIARALMRVLGESGSIRTISHPGAFNWSAMNNRAADQSRGDVLVFLNNDILAISEGWLDELVGQALRPEIGAVGARLLYADGSIQHAGVILGVNGSSCHEAIGEPVANGGYLGRSHLQRRVSAVTGACLATRRDVFDRVQRFDEATFGVTCNDIDYCLKVQAAGFGVVYTPFSTLHHFESASRGYDSTRRPDGGVDAELAALRARWPAALRNDPFYNPHFSRAAPPFTYLTPLEGRLTRT